jgi:hypothetical protein
VTTSGYIATSTRSSGKAFIISWPVSVIKS